MTEEAINFVVPEETINEPIESVNIKKPKKPKVTKKPKIIEKVIKKSTFEESHSEPKIDYEKPLITPVFGKPNESKETMGYDTLNPFIYKFVNYLILPNLVVTIILIVLVAINVIWFPNLVWNLYGGIITTVASIITFILLFLISSTSLKKNDLIVIRKFRSGAGTVSRLNFRGKSEILFDKKDPSSKVSIAWSGAITDPLSGCKIIQISEGHPTNDNLNAQVSESEWDKDVARLTKAKSIADLAEAELFNQGLLGLKWQDFVLIIIAVLCVGIIFYLITGAPDAIAKKTIEGLMNGSIQNAIQQGLANAGILTPVANP